MGSFTPVPFYNINFCLQVVPVLMRSVKIETEVIGIKEVAMISVVIIVAIIVALVAIMIMLIGSGSHHSAPKKANLNKVQQRLGNYPVLRSWVWTWTKQKKGRAYYGNSLSTWEEGGILHAELRLRKADFSKVSLSGTFAQVVWKLEDMCNQ